MTTPSRPAPAPVGAAESAPSRHALDAGAPPAVFVVSIAGDAGHARHAGHAGHVGPLPNALETVSALRPFAVGDGGVWEGVLADGAAVIAALRLLLRGGGPHVGVGYGCPRPQGTGARGQRAPAYAAARVALGAAGRSHQGVALRATRRRGGAAPAPRSVEDAETCLWLLADIWRRRTPEGWVVADLMDSGLTGRACAQRLDISPSAVSQRAAAARYVESRRATDLAARLLDALRTP